MNPGFDKERQISCRRREREIGLDTREIEALVSYRYFQHVV